MIHGTLLAAHRSYELLLLTYSQPAYWPFCRQHEPAGRRLTHSTWRTGDQLMALLHHPTIHCNCTNVLMHAQGCFTGTLPARGAINSPVCLTAIAKGYMPLLTPITLLKHYMAAYPNVWLTQQRYFEAYPEALLLRTDISPYGSAMTTHLVWLRNDLRMHDNSALYAACQNPLCAYAGGVYAPPQQWRNHDNEPAPDEIYPPTSVLSGQGPRRSDRCPNHYSAPAAFPPPASPDLIIRRQSSIIAKHV